MPDATTTPPAPESDQETPRPRCRVCRGPMRKAGFNAHGTQRWACANRACDESGYIVLVVEGRPDGRTLAGKAAKARAAREQAGEAEKKI
jgi:hypothetical protein